MQRDDHFKFDSEYDATNPLTTNIPLADRSDPWDSRPSIDEGRYSPPGAAVRAAGAPSAYGHVRQGSTGSIGQSPVQDSPLRARSATSNVRVTLVAPALLAR